MRMLSKEHESPAKIDRGDGSMSLMSALVEATVDLAQEKAAEASPYQLGCGTKMLGVALASVDRTVRSKRRMSRKLLRRLAAVYSSLLIRSGRQVENRCRKLLLTFSKMAVITAFRNGCVMHRRPRQRLGRAELNEVTRAQLMKL